jgi:hypothetical protein
VSLSSTIVTVFGTLTGTTYDVPVDEIVNEPPRSNASTALIGADDPAAGVEAHPAPHNSAMAPASRVVRTRLTFYTTTEMVPPPGTLWSCA